MDLDNTRPPVSADRESSSLCRKLIPGKTLVNGGTNAGHVAKEPSPLPERDRGGLAGGPIGADLSIGGVAEIIGPASKLNATVVIGFSRGRACLGGRTYAPRL